MSYVLFSPDYFPKAIYFSWVPQMMNLFLLAVGEDLTCLLLLILEILFIRSLQLIPHFNLQDNELGKMMGLILFTELQLGLGKWFFIK